MERKMAQVGTMVKVIKGRYEGEKGRLIAIYPADDGMTLVVKTPKGDVNIDIPVMTAPTEYLEPLPKMEG
jgi:transcription antitermination factor NusG